MVNPNTASSSMEGPPGMVPPDHVQAVADPSKRPIVAVILTLVLFLLGGFWFFNSRQMANRTDEISSREGLEDEAALDKITSELTAPLLSVTEGADGRSGRSLLPGELSTAKREGMEALAAGDYEAAQLKFAAALEENRNDPESRIYLNNAKIGDSVAHTIAAAMPIGEVLSPSLELMRGVAQVQDSVNAAGGVNGVPLRVLLFDDQGEPDRAKEIAADLVADETVLGVVGHYSSDASLAAAEVYEPGGLTMISPISTAVKFSDAGDYIFRTVPSDLLAAKTLASHTLEEMDKTKAAVFYTRESTYSQSIQSEFSRAFESNGGEVVKSFDISTPWFDPNEALASANTAGADVIMLALTIDTSDISLQVIASNRQSLPMVGGDDLYDPKLLAEGQRNVLGLTVAVPWHIRRHLESSFVVESQRLWGGDVNWRTVTAYDAAQALVEALETDPTREGVANALSQPDFTADGATSEILFSQKGDRDQPSQLVKVVPGPRSGTGYDYVPADR